MFCAECGARVPAPSGTLPPPPGAYATNPPPPGPHAVTAAGTPVPPPPTSAVQPPPPPPAPEGPPPPPPAPVTRRDVVGTEFPVVPGSVAPVGRRVGAYALDLVALALLGGIGFAIGLASGGDSPDLAHLTVSAMLPSVLTGVGGIALWVAESMTGATLGAAILGIRTVSVATGRPAGLGRILVRQLVVGVGTLACAVGNWVVVASGAFDKEPAQRGWHDKAAGTLVLRAGAAGVARTTDPAVAWDRAVARAVGPVPPPPSTPPTPSAPPTPPAPPATPTASSLVPPPPAAPAPVVGHPVSDPPSGPASDPPSAAPSSVSEPPAAPIVDVPPTIGLVPLPPAAGSRPPAAPDALITGFPGAVAPAPASGAAPGAGLSGPLDGGALPPAALGSTPSGGESTVPSVPAPPPVVTPRVEPAAADALAGTAAGAYWADGVDDIELTRLRTPAAGTPAASAGLRLAFDTGERVDVVGDGVVGRDPQGDVPHVVAIDDPARSLSKTHLAFGPGEAGTLWVVDRGSTNGTVVVRPDGSAATLPAGARAVVAAGWSLRIGERTVRVEAR